MDTAQFTRSRWKGQRGLFFVPLEAFPPRGSYEPSLVEAPPRSILESLTLLWRPTPFGHLVAFNNEQGSKCPAGQCMQEAMQWQQRGRAPSILFLIFKLVLLIFLSTFSSQHSCLFFSSHFSWPSYNFSFLWKSFWFNFPLTVIMPV